MLGQTVRIFLSFLESNPDHQKTVVLASSYKVNLQGTLFIFSRNVYSLKYRCIEIYLNVVIKKMIALASNTCSQSYNS